jgi:hypothetical protein
MDPVTLSVAAAVLKFVGAAFAAGLIATAFVKFLTWAGVIDWLRRKRQTLSATDGKKISFLVGESLRNGNYKEIVGVFDTETNQVDAQAYEAEEIDSTLKSHHKDAKVLILR